MGRLKRFAAYIAKALMTAGLFIVYFLGLGLTRVLAAVFEKRREGPADTYWLKCEGYEPDKSELARGS
ncbi:MAG: hypothetical protein WC728_01930 [Elusimicrobiota bacterium]